MLKDIGKTEAFDAHLPISNIISFIACVRLVNYAMVTDGNREANLIAMVAVRANSVKCHLIVIVYHMISNAKKEKLVIDLYYNQRKIVRQTAQQAGMSFRDIAAVLKKKEEAAAVNGGNGSGNGIVAMDNQQQQLGNDSSQSNQKSTQSYKLFSEGKIPVEVAIQLNRQKRKEPDSKQNTGD